jgi:excisionase family DNA binding protein
MALRSIRQAADAWGVSVYTARRLAAAGLVNSVTVGRRRLISESEIERIATRGVPSAATAIRLRRGVRHEGQGQ